MKRALSYFWPKAPWIHVYMLQQVEYNPSKFIAWAASFPNLLSVQKRGQLNKTRRAQLMLILAYGVWLFFVGTGLATTVAMHNIVFLLIAALAPVASMLAVYLTTYVLQTLVVEPRHKREITAAKTKLEQMPAVRIAVIGSYGKTSMKEMLTTILSEGKRVAATPGNKNVLISHARWINGQLRGDEEMLIFEYGEGAPGDILKLARLSNPHYAIVTGLAPAHLDAYPSLESIADDFATIGQFITDDDKLYINGEASLLRDKMIGNFYDEMGVAGWEVSDVAIGFEGTTFKLKRTNRSLTLHTGLLGRHQIGPLAAAVALAAQLGLTNEQIIAGVAVTTAFEHRMQAQALQGAWIIDDTYNGNIEGMRAGLALLKELPAKRKIYVTPGLVDQGEENIRVHEKLGRLIAEAKPDTVVLMKNSNTAYIETGLKAGTYSGELSIEDNPLEYYTNLEHYLAAGDIAMLQNDLPDSYR